MSFVPEFKTFREHVNHIPHYRNSIIVKVAYLTAARVSEIITRISKADEGNTKPYGKHQTWKFEKYKGKKYLLITQGVLKRRAVKGRPVLKVIALPTDPVYEPWTLDIMKYLRTEGRLTFDLTRQALTQIIKDSLRSIIQDNEQPIKNRLRHYRLTHLMSIYDFEPYDLNAIAGWSFRTGFSKFGLSASPQMQYYIHYAWKQYAQKLLKPIRDI